MQKGQKLVERKSFNYGPFVILPNLNDTKQPFGAAL